MWSCCFVLTVKKKPPNKDYNFIYLLLSVIFSQIRFFFLFFLTFIFGRFSRNEGSIFEAPRAQCNRTMQSFSCQREPQPYLDYNGNLQVILWILPFDFVCMRERQNKNMNLNLVLPMHRFGVMHINWKLHKGLQWHLILLNRELMCLSYPHDLICWCIVCSSKEGVRVRIGG